MYPRLISGDSAGVDGVTTADFNGDGILISLWQEATLPTVRASCSARATAASRTQQGVRSFPATDRSGRRRATSTGTAFRDLAIANYGDDTVSIYQGKGDGTFTVVSGSPISVGFDWSMTTGDLNGDGTLDLAVTNSGDSPGDVSVLLEMAAAVSRTPVAVRSP